MVGRLFLRFWEGRLYTIGLNYDARDFKWSSTQSETSTISERLGFPKFGWNDERLICNGFYINLNRSNADEVGVEIADSAVKEEMRKKAETSISAYEKYLASPPVLHKRPETKPILKDPRKPRR